MVKKIYIKKQLSEGERIAAEAEENYKYYANLGRRKGNATLLLILGTVLAAVFSLFLIMTPMDFNFFIGVDEGVGKGILAFVVGFSISVYGTYLFFSYLRPVEFSKSDTASSIRLMDKLLGGYERRLAAAERKYDSILEKLQGGGGGGEIFSEDERAQLLNELKGRLESDVFEEYFKGLVLKISEGQKFKQREDVFAKTIARLEMEIQNQSKRGNVNLLLGILTTIFGVLALGYSVLQAPVFKDGMEIVSHFLPRISLVVVVEVFAYFFLRLYKQSLDEIKFFQNEMTNVESKYLALYVATEDGHREGVLAVINKLSSTERNFILEKGQSTIALEQHRIDTAANGAAVEGLVSMVSDLLKKK